MGLARAVDQALRQAHADMMSGLGFSWVHEDGWAVKRTYRRGHGS